MSTEFDTGDHQSDSDLSEAQDVVVADPDTRESPSSLEDAPAPNHAGHDAYASDGGMNSASTKDEASDDGDFDGEEGAPSPRSDQERDERSASASSRSRPSSKNKSPAEDSYIQQNPELYGLRRSVRQ